MVYEGVDFFFQFSAVGSNDFLFVVPGCVVAYFVGSCVVSKRFHLDVCVVSVVVDKFESVGNIEVEASVFVRTDNAEKCFCRVAILFQMKCVCVDVPVVMVGIVVSVGEILFEGVKFVSGVDFFIDPYFIFLDTLADAVDTDE